MCRGVGVWSLGMCGEYKCVWSCGCVVGVHASCT